MWALVRNLGRPGYARVIAGKLRRRVSNDGKRRDAAVSWYAARRVSPTAYCEAIDPELALEAASFGEEVRARARAMSAEVGFELGSGGRYELLYFLTRLHRPRAVVETGVAYGYSSYAFLRALERNGDGGRLWSSDFPFFRMPNPERFVGILVPDGLRTNWSLHTSGDAANLPEILAEVDAIDLFHYDSDKTSRGRAFGCDLVLPKLAARGVFLMDDIQDNAFFRDYVTEHAVEHVVFGASDRAFVGAVGVAPMSSAAPS
jgi:predicted O-methyltransferase YrrM